MLSHYRGAAVAQQLIVVQQRSGNGILNGGHAYDGWILLYAGIHLLEGLTAYQLQLLALEILMGCNVVKRPYLSLYGYSLHIPKKKPHYHSW
jgi:hypothetical protein